MHSHKENQRFWEEIRLLESIVEDVREESESEQVRKINWFLNEQCEILSVGHEKCIQMLEDDPVLPAYESIEAYRENTPHVVGCYGCGEMYQVDSDNMPSQFERLRDRGVINVGHYDYDRTLEVSMGK